MKKHIYRLLFFLIIGLPSNAQVLGLWGVTYYQGSEFSGNGVIFQWCNNLHYTVMHTFTGGTTDGANPDCTLFKAADGNLYGTTVGGGANSDGTIYEFNISTMTYSMKISLANATGDEIWGGALIQPVAATPVLYGITGNGGADAGGCIFTYNYNTNTYSDIHDFGSVVSDGDGPNNQTPLYDAGSGLMYVVTKYGGNNSSFTAMGAIHSFNPSNIGGTYTLLYTFQWDVTPNYGNEPTGMIAEASNGTNNCLYGTTISGGADGNGVIWQYNLTTNTYTDIHDFGSVGSDGEYAQGLMYDATNGLLYGLSYEGGTDGWGNLFSINPSTHAYTIVHQFLGGNTDGAYAEGQMYIASDGKLYGVASEGGNNPSNSGGLIFQYNPSTNAFTDEYNLQPAGGVEPYFSGLTEVDVSICGALPIQLLSFTGEYDANTFSSDLNWSTATEVNNHYFFIQRSTDGQNWQTIDTLAGSGNSNDTRYYSLKDYNPPIGMNYYKLIQEDYDGNRQSFNIVTIEATAAKTAKLYPNPATSIVNIEGNDLQSATIYNTLGQSIWTANATDSKIAVDVSYFANGIYIVQVIDKIGNTTMLRFVKEGSGSIK